MAIPNYLQQSPKTGVWSFRRSVPRELREKLGKREIKKSLKTTDLRLARRLAQTLSDQSDILFAPSADVPEATPQLMYEMTKAWAVSQGFDPETPSPDRTDMEMARDAAADDVIARLRSGSGSVLDGFKLDAMRGELRRPAPTIKDAVELYLTERNGPSKERIEADKRSTEQMVRRYERYLLASLRRNKRLADVNREDARKFRDSLVSAPDLRDSKHDKKLKPSSVNKAIRIVRAIFNFAIREWEIDCRNPFAGLKVEESESARDKRRAFTEEEAKAYLSATQGLNDEARLCTVLMAYTGARTAEIAGLEKQDVQLDHSIPHLIIRRNSHRRLKTGPISKRLIPLVGQGLTAAQEATELAEKRKAEDLLFPSYGKPRGEDVLSQLQNGLIRAKISKDPTLTAYSTRHRMKDLLRDALVPSDLQDAIFGHSRGQASEAYGDGYGLPRLKEALEKALAPTREIVSRRKLPDSQARSFAE